MSRNYIFTGALFVAATSAIWIYSFVVNTFFAREIGIYLLFFLVPIVLVLGSLWVLWNRAIWRRVVGSILLIPSLLVWLVSTLLVLGEFRIH